MKIARIILSLLLNRRQREIIWQALTFSAHTYIRRGNAKGAAAVMQVINETDAKFNISKRVFTKEEVEELIDRSSTLISRKVGEIAKEQYEKGIIEGRKQVPRRNTHLIFIGIDEDESEEREEFSQERCEACPESEGCTMYNVVLKEAFEEANQKTEEKGNEDITEEAPKGQIPVRSKE